MPTVGLKKNAFVVPLGAQTAQGCMLCQHFFGTRFVAFSRKYIPLHPVGKKPLDKRKIRMTEGTPFAGLKAAFYTLGCKLNFSETSTIGQALKDAGFRTVRGGEKADVVVINTCSVTEVADRKGRQAIHRLTRNHPGAFVIVTGCYAQLKPDEVALISGVNLVLGQNEKGRVLQHLASAFGNRLTEEAHGSVTPVAGGENIVHCKSKDIREFTASCSRGDRTRYWLKVQDGCDYFCSYCTIPYARGRSRNGSIASLVEQAQKVADEGGKEIVITGVNIGDFGKSTGEDFFSLICALDAVGGIERYRISSIEPDLLTDDIIAFVARSRAFMPHFHIPLQSGSDTVLKLMRRRYDTALFAHKIGLIRQTIPDAFIGVDVIVGTRGETADAFEETCRFLQSLDITQLHVFSYSERPGTSALKIEGPVAAADKHLRSQRLLALSDEKTQLFYSRHIGSEAVVLLEHPKPGMPFHGFTPNYIRVEMDASSMLLKENTLLPVRLTGFNADRSALIASPV